MVLDGVVRPANVDIPVTKVFPRALRTETCSITCVSGASTVNKTLGHIKSVVSVMWLSLLAKYFTVTMI